MKDIEARALRNRDVKKRLMKEIERVGWLAPLRHYGSEPSCDDGRR